MKRSIYTAAVVLVCAAGLPLTGCGGQSRAKSIGHDTAASVHQPQLGESPLVMLDSYGMTVDQLDLGDIVAELEAIADHDRTLTELAIDSPDQAVSDRIRSSDRMHADRVKEIVMTIGWPSADAVGSKAAYGAFVAVQHAGHDIDFQDHCLGLLVPLSENGRVPPQYLALLSDRIRLFGGEEQVFGTQMTFKEDRNGVVHAVPSIPIEDVANLDNRRAMMGMPPHDQFTRLLEEAYEFTGSTRGAQSAAGAWTE